MLFKKEGFVQLKGKDATPAVYILNGSLKNTVEKEEPCVTLTYDVGTVTFYGCKIKDTKLVCSNCEKGFEKAEVIGHGDGILRYFQTRKCSCSHIMTKDTVYSLEKGRSEKFSKNIKGVRIDYRTKTV